ncbi:class I SAM-dependent methyltransferase [Nocardioides sp. YIM 152315]|uniref:class I SAM-dependent methyltransferase n=1 Tax=Nocardioides sp. YIM 152315 TaxID=3031760 RepID=UPI0023DA3A7A|nr:class I SAM-dependent methyltransferase [Nocardioides sp. YIM 152315]MDF1602454.1 class I SAM-dependent methyltransferase [Nocardioides sp. YIM 152315]
MGWWTDRVVPHLADRSLSSRPVMERRARAVDGLAGRVLEIGFGSGRNATLYPDAVVSVDAVEPSDVGWRMSGERRAASRVPITRAGLDGQRLEAEDAAYDAVLSTFTLCTIPDVTRALAEVRRVLRPGGSLHFLEHGLAPQAGVADWQRRLDPVQRLVAGGCNLSRDVPGLVTTTGFTMADLEASYLPGPGVGRPWTYLYAGRAVAPA